MLEIMHSSDKIREVQIEIILATTSTIIFIPGGSDGKESAYNAGGLGSIWGQDDPLEKGIATQSSILAWKIPWTEEPGWLQSM